MQVHPLLHGNADHQLAQRQKKAKSAVPSSPALTDADLNPPSTRTSFSIEDGELPPPPKGERRRKEENAEAGPSNAALIVERDELQSRLAAESASAQADRQLLEEGRGVIARLEEEKATLEARISELDAAADEARAELEALRKSHDEEAAGRADQEAVRREALVDLERSLGRAREREGGLEAEVARLRQVRRCQTALTPARDGAPEEPRGQVD